MPKKTFTGVGTALITPFRNYDIDMKALAFHIERQIANGVDFLVPCGTTGESPTLDTKEHLDLIEMTVALAKGRVPIMAGTGSNCTDEAVELTQGAKDRGADAALVVFPYYNKPEPAGQLDYYRSVAQVGLPVCLYDIQGRCGRRIDPDVLYQLADEGSIFAMKWASGDFQQAAEIRANTPEDFILLSGDDALTLQLILNSHGNGVISVTSNVTPELMSEFINLALAEQQKHEAVNALENLLPLMNCLFTESNPQPVKTAMHLCFPEIFAEEFRSPMMKMRPENREKLKNLLTLYEITE